MNAVRTSKPTVVTPADGRSRARRAPQARPVQPQTPGRRPVQPGGPLVMQPFSPAPVPVSRTARAHRSGAVAATGVQLTDRGIALVVVLLALITVAVGGVGLVKFFGVSDAPIEGHATVTQAQVPGVASN